MDKPPQKAISIRQPWAWLIVNSFKDVENRSWKTKYRGPDKEIRKYGNRK
jgi:hypothetical protein